MGTLYYLCNVYISLKVQKQRERERGRREEGRRERSKIVKRMA